MQRKITPRSEKLKQLGGFKPVTHGSELGTVVLGNLKPPVE